MRVVTYQKMKEIDALAVKKFLLSEEVLMENAGINLCASFLKELKPRPENSIVIICGGGNNGGDGYVLARQLFSRGYSNLKIINLSSKLTALTETNRERAKLLGISIYDFSDDFKKVYSYIKDADFIFDCICGVGLLSPLRDKYKDLINYINKAKACTISVDVPSGLYPGFGENDFAISADYLFTIELLKNVFYNIHARKFCGEILSIPIGFPKALYADQKNRLITEKLCLELVGKKENLDDFTYKNKRGHLCVIAGSTTYTGAASLSANSASFLAGLVSLYSLDELNTSTFHSVIHIDKLEKDKNYNAFLLGPGIIDKDFLKKTLFEIDNFKKPIVLDAGVFDLELESIVNLKNPKILTPHIDEFSRFFNFDKKQVLRNTEEYLLKACELSNSAIVLKNAITLIGSPNKEIYYLDHPSIVKATAGSGDVLAGVIAAYLSLGYSVNDAAILGTWSYSKAAELAFNKKGLINADMFSAYLPEVLANILLNKRKICKTREDYEL